MSEPVIAAVGLHKRFTEGAGASKLDVHVLQGVDLRVQQGDIVPIAIISLVLAFLATLYPSWRASRLQPAEALRYE